MHRVHTDFQMRNIDSSLVLLARIVDGAGRPVPISEVASIEYSVFVRDSCARGPVPTDAERQTTRLVVSDVLSATLVCDEMWSIDMAGYNFRHVVAIGNGIATLTPGSHLELRYLFTSMDNMKSIVRFHLKIVKKRHSERSSAT